MRSKVLIVDDMELNREMLAAILEKDYPILEADSGKKAIAMIQKHQAEIAVVLLDLIMPNVDGFAVLEVMKNQSWLKDIPVLVITAESKAEVESKCFEMGVSDFIKKPFDNAIVRNRVRNIVDLFGYKNQLEEKVEKQTETLKKQYKLLVMQAEKLKESKTKIIDILGTVVECRNLESGEHIKRVKGFTRILAQQMMKDYPEYGLNQETIEVIVSASALHDIGKIAIPDSILLKPGRLTNEEFDVMKTHTTKGCDILKHVSFIDNEEFYRYCYNICRHHHEKYDGRGYPDGLKGDEIPLEAQIVSIADIYDALVSVRVYKAAYTYDEAYNMILNGECGQFSDMMMDCFKAVKKDFENLAKQNSFNG